MVAPATPAYASLGAKQSTTGVIPGRYIVVFKRTVDYPGRVAGAQINRHNGTLGFVYRHNLKGYSAALSDVALRVISRDPRVAYVEPDVRGGIAAQTIPTGIKRSFATANKVLALDEKDDLKVNADIAILDTGIDYKHEDLNVVARTDCSSGAKKHSECVNESGTDTNSHGTHVAGIAAAIDNGVGVTGIAPGARLWAVKVAGTGEDTLSEFIAGIEWVTTHSADIEVANASLRYPVTSSQAFSDAAKAMVEAGVVFVVAAGNDHETVKYVPGNYADAITVSALADFDGQAGAKAGNSSCRELYEFELAVLGLAKETDDSYANFSNKGSQIDVAAPGVCIRSTVPGNKYEEVTPLSETWSGTSMAAPHVAGAAAIMASHLNPNSKADVEAIRESVVKAGNKAWTDDSGDGVQEALLDLSNETVFHAGPRISAVLTSTGKLYVKSGLSKAWIEINPTGVTVASASVGTDYVNGPVIGAIGSNGTAYAKQGVYGTWVEEYAGAKSISMASDSKNGPVIGIIANNEKAYAKQGLAGAWVEEYAGAKSISMASDSKNGPVIGIIANNEEAYAKQGLAGAWVEEYAGAKSISMASHVDSAALVGVVGNDAHAYVKQGLLGEWVDEFEGIQFLGIAN